MAPSLDTPRLGANFTSKTHHDTYAEINPASTPASCAGKTVLITGAVKGVGRAIVISYARAGASRIAITASGDALDTRAEALKAAADAGRKGLEVVVLKLDVCDYKSIEACVAEVSSAWGHVDILVNNTGYLAAFEPLGTGDKDEWWQTWEVDVRGVYLLVRALSPLLLRSNDKTVINISSIGVLALAPGASAYDTSKMAFLSISEYMMLEYIEQGLLVYSVNPGSIQTELGSKLPNATKAVFNHTPELAGDTVAYLTSKRREWLAGRHVSSAWDMPELMTKERDITQNDLLKFRMTFETGRTGQTRKEWQPRMRVPRSSY